MLSWLSLSIVACLHVIHAQTTSSPGRPATSSGDDKVIELSPFEVTSDQDVGYLAANSLSGSRLNTSLRDIAASVSVFTEEFMSDIGALSFQEAAVYANNLSFDYQEANTAAVPNMNSSMVTFQSYRVRGLPVTMARNYFEMNVPADNFNVARIEDARGPNSVLFGIAQAGGLINTATKQPMLGRSFMKVTALYGSYDSYRGTVDVNQVVANGRLAARFNAVYDRINTYRYFAFNNNRRVHLALKYSLAKKTSVRVEYEGGIIRSNLSRPFGPGELFFAWNNAGRPLADAPNQAVTGTVSIGAAARITYIENDDRLLNLAGTRVTNGTWALITDKTMTDRSINISGPGTTRYADYDTASAFVEHRFGEKSFLELAWNYQSYENDSKMILHDTHLLTGDPNKYLPNGQLNPHAGQLFFDGTWSRYITSTKSTSFRSTWASQFDAGKWGDYRVVAMGDYTDSREKLTGLRRFWEGAPFNATPEHVANMIFFRNYVTEGDWSTYHGGADRGFVNMTDSITGRTLSSVWYPYAVGQLRDVPTTVKSLMLATQARYFNDRLIASLGWREDRADSLDRPIGTVRDPVTKRLMVNYDSAVDTNFTGRTRTLGLVGHLTENISVLGNYATNLGLPPTSARIIGGRMAPPREGVGKDFGLATTFFGGRVYGRAVYYETAATNLIQSVVAMETTNEAILQTAVNNKLISEAEAEKRSLGQLTVLRKDSASKGYEFQLSGNLTPNWRITTNFSITDNSDSNVDPELRAWFTDNFAFWATLPQDMIVQGTNNQTVAAALKARKDQMDEIYNMEGKTTSGNRKYKGSAFTRYAFDSGPLKGLSVGGGFLSQSKVVVGRSGLGTDKFAYAYGNSFWRADAMLGYDVHGLPRGIRCRLQLNVTNVFNNLDPQVLRYVSLDPNDRTPLRMVETPPREWRLTVDFDF